MSKKRKNNFFFISLFFCCNSNLSKSKSEGGRCSEGVQKNVDREVGRKIEE
jgi:hypothetical protein